MRTANPGAARPPREDIVVTSRIPGFTLVASRPVGHLEIRTIVRDLQCINRQHQIVNHRHRYITPSHFRAESPHEVFDAEY